MTLHWLPQFIADRIIADERLRGRPPQASGDGLMLMGTLGYASYLLPDGTIWVEQDTDWTGPQPRIVWRRAALQEGLGQLRVATSRFPELVALIPPLPPGEPPCPRCSGAGELHFSEAAYGSPGALICDWCLGLGWRVAQPSLRLSEVPWKHPWTPTEPGLAKQLTKELSSKHPLFGIQAVAVARRLDRDDVLFQLRTGPAPYAEIHLTWAAHRDEDGHYPLFRLYDDLTSWMHSWPSS